MKRKDVLKMDGRELDKLVTIQGTEFDRKRALSDKMIKKLNKLHKKGLSVNEIRKKLNLNWHTVKYNVDPEYRAMHLSRCGKHTGTTHITSQERIEYKRSLILNRKLKVQ